MVIHQVFLCIKLKIPYRMIGKGLVFIKRN